MRTIEAVRTTSGSRAAVWELLADGPAWARWGPWREAAVEGGGELGPGAVRVLVSPPFRVRERIVDWQPGERLVYEMLDGMRVDGYRSEVRLEDRPEGGTVIRWRSSYDSAGPLTRVVLRLAIPAACRRLAKAASASGG